MKKEEILVLFENSNKSLVLHTVLNVGVQENFPSFWVIHNGEISRMS